MAGPRTVVEPPDFSPLPFSLWDSVQQRSGDGDPHWRNGVTWQQRCPQVPDTLYDECIAVTGTGSPPAFPTLPVGGNVLSTNQGATPFTVYAEYDCSPVGLDDFAYAETAMARMEAYAVENAFWTGKVGNTTSGLVANIALPHLAANAQILDANQIVLQNAASQVVTGTGVDVTDGLGQLESALATCYGGTGVIHIPLAVLPTFNAWNLVVRDGPVLRTVKGNLVVAGSGYPGTSPAGAAPAAGQTWIYATGAVFGYRSDVWTVSMPETFDRAKNTVRSLAQRTYVLGYECCLLAAQVATGVPATGGGGI